MIKNEKLKWINIPIWIVSIFVMIRIMMMGTVVADDNNFNMAIESFIIAIVSLFFLYVISGRKTFTYMNNKTGYTIKVLLPVLIFPALFFFFGIVEVFSENPSNIENWPINLLFGVFNMFLVGLYEETCFRACACDAMLPVLRKTKHPFLLTALISSLVFGYVHVADTDLTDFQQILQFVLKIINTGLYGYTLMLAYYKTRNLFALAVIHGLNDLLPYFLYFIFAFPEIETTSSYTAGDTATTVVYIVQLVFEIVVLHHVYKDITRNLDYKKTLEEW